MPINAPFYVKAKNGTLVPEKFLADTNGNLVVNSNATPNPVYSKARLQYYTVDGQIIENANPNNYLVVPYNYSLQTTASFAKDVAWTDDTPGAGLPYMIAAFSGPGSQNLQRIAVVKQRFRHV